MGAVLAALGASAGTVKAVQTAVAAKNAYDQMRGGDPGVGGIPQGLEGLPDFGQSGTQAAAPQQMQDQTPAVPQLAMADLTGQPSQSAPSPTPVDNPYVQDSPQEVANSIGTSGDQTPITITGDSWQPKKESTLGKIGDVLLMLRGQKPIFRERTDAANLQDAMRGFQDNPTRAVNRAEKVDPSFAASLYEHMQAAQANQELMKNRQQDRQDAGMGKLSSVLGVVTSAKDPAATYQKMLPSFQGFAKMYGIDPSILPSTYDADQINALRSGGISTYDQGRLAQEADNAASTNAYRQTMVSLDKLGKQISLANLRETIKNDNQTQARLTQGQILTAKQDAAKNGISLNEGLAPYMSLKIGQYAVSPNKQMILMKKPDGYIYSYPIQHRGDGSSFIDTDNPAGRGTTVQGYMSK